MFSFSRIQVLSFAAANVLLALTAVGAPAVADEMVDNLGPVGPHEPILATVGNKRFLAYYEPDGGRCGFIAVIWNNGDVDASSAARVQISLNAHQTVRIDGAPNKSLALQCGDNAASLAVVARSGQLAFGAAE
jgi:hypothetical protein